MSLIIKRIPKPGKYSLILGMVLILMTGTVTTWMEDNRPQPIKNPVKRIKMVKTETLFTQNVLQQQTLPDFKKPAPPIPKPVPRLNQNQTVVTGTQWENELPWLARVIHAEAGGESLKGQVAVGAVLLNRIKSGKFPKTLKANIFRPGEFESVANGYIWSNPSSSSYKAARLALGGWDPTYGALYFFNPAKTRSSWIWGRPVHTVIGQHNFAG